MYQQLLTCFLRVKSRAKHLPQKGQPQTKNPASWNENESSKRLDNFLLPFQQPALVCVEIGDLTCLFLPFGVGVSGSSRASDKSNSEKKVGLNNKFGEPSGISSWAEKARWVIYIGLDSWHWHIYLLIYHTSQLNVKVNIYVPSMDPMGIEILLHWEMIHLKPAYFLFAPSSWMIPTCSKKRPGDSHRKMWD